MVTHIAVHFVIFFAYVAAVFNVPQAFKSLINLNRITLVAGGGFFLFCGMTHLGLALEESNHFVFVVSDHLQAISIVAFLISLSNDLKIALRRLNSAFKVIRITYGKDGERMIATVIAALQGSEHHDRPSP